VSDRGVRHRPRTLADAIVPRLGHSRTGRTGITFFGKDNDLADNSTRYRAFDTLNTCAATNRRRFVQRTAALGVGTPIFIDAVRTSGTNAQQATPAAQIQPVRGGSVTIAFWAEPTTVNLYLSARSADSRVANLVVEPLLTTANDGNYQPVLATDVPTQENGGVSEDGTGITYRLKQGVLWSDGQPFTSADVKFTFDAIMNDANPITARGPYEQIAFVETPDEHTVVVTWKEFFAPYLLAFADGILPSHYFGGNTDINQSEFDRNQVGTGPFVVTSWEAGSAIILQRNENYREEGKPYLDQVICSIVPNASVATAQLQAGEIDMVMSLRESEGVFLQQQNDPNIALLVSPSPSIERVLFNLAAPGTPTDPSVPHPILSDAQVRQALEHATPRQEIVDQLIGGGFVEVTGSTLPIGWAAPDPPLPATEYNLKQAAQLLEAAGWTMGDDGVRQKDGQPLRLRIVSTPEQHRTLVMQLLAERWGEIGVAVEVSNQQSTVVLGSWEENGTRAIGNFDCVIFATSSDPDPHTHYLTRYHSDGIPTTENGGSGDNYNRLADPLLDDLIVAAGSIVDQEERKAIYRQVNEQLNSHHANIWLYSRSGIDAYRARIVGLEPQAWDSATFNTEDWFVTDGAG